MPHSYALSRTCLVAAAVLGLTLPTVILAQTDIPVGRFKSVTLRNGGRVVIRHGIDQKVTLLKGSTSHTGVTTAVGARLVIDRCGSGCPDDHDLVVEVFTPELVELMVLDGGLIQTRGSFPRQSGLEAAVRHGGMIDFRSMRVDDVNAAVEQGGRIYGKPQRTLVASVAQGGNITYWGDPRVTSSIDKGGVIARGANADADKVHLDHADPGMEPPVPPVPPVAPRKVRRSSL